MMQGFQRSHSGYLQLDVPLPADEERLYPSLEVDRRDHRVLPPPTDAPVVIAPQQMMPSAPVFGGNRHAPQPRYAVSSMSSVPMQPVMQYQAPNSQGYVPLLEEKASSAPLPYPGMPLPPPFEPFICDTVQEAPSVQEITDRIKHSSRLEFRIQSMFGYAWRFFGKNFCVLCGTQMIMLGILIGLFVLEWFLWSNAIHTGTYHNSHKRYYLYLFLLQYGLSSLIALPLFLALLYSTLRAIQTNRFLMVGEFMKFFSQYYCRFFLFCAITSLMVMPYYLPISLGGYFVYVFLFSFAAPLKFQYPQMGVCKAYYLSARVSLTNWARMLLLTFVLLLFNAFAVMSFGIGLFVSIPVSMAVNVYVYHKLVGLHTISGYTRMDGHAEENGYDGSGAVLDQTLRHAQQQVQMQQIHQQQQLQQQLQAPVPQQQQPQRLQYVQLVPVMPMQVSAPGILPPPVVSGGAPGGPVVVMRSSAVNNM